AARLQGQHRRRPRGPPAAALGRAGRHLPLGEAPPLLHGPVPARLPGRAGRLHRGRRGEPALAVHGRRRPGGRLDRRGLHHLPAPAPAGTDGGGAHMTPTPPAGARIAGAPISWGVCEVPGWGYQLGPDRVLAEMREVGLTATEFGPDGFLPGQPDAMTRVLDHHGLQAIGGFTPLLLHVDAHDPVPEVERLLQGYDASGAEVLVLSAVPGAEGYDSRPVLDDDEWMVLLANLDRLADLARQRGVRAVLHPHVGTMIETGEEVRQVLDGSWISLCLDTGHLLIGGTDPAELARQAPERIAHIHFKDVD